MKVINSLHQAQLHSTYGLQYFLYFLSISWCIIFILSIHPSVYNLSFYLSVYLSIYPGASTGFWLGGAKSLARSAKKRFAQSAKKFSTIAPLKIDFAPQKTHFCPSKIKFLKIFGGGPCPPQNQLWGGHGPLCPPLWMPLVPTTLSVFLVCWENM